MQAHLIRPLICAARPRCRCATPFGVDVVGITELIALVGALVGGIAARQRKLEAERLNEQLRKINMQLRQQARAGTIYAPGLSYAPAASASTATRTPSTASVESAAAPPAGAAQDAEGGGAATMTRAAPQAALSTMDEEITPEQMSCRETMREGKRLLRSGQGARRRTACAALRQPRVLACTSRSTQAPVCRSTAAMRTPQPRLM